MHVNVMMDARHDICECQTNIEYIQISDQGTCVWLLQYHFIALITYFDLNDSGLQHGKS